MSKSHPNPRWPLYRAAGVILLAMFLAGCSVTVPTLEETAQRELAESDRLILFAGQQPVPDHPISVANTIARAVKYNLDVRVERMKEAVETGDFDLASYDLMPDAAVNAGFDSRNNDDASVSRNIDTGITGGSPSSSEQRDRFNADVEVTWNVLDFGLAMARARQKGNSIHIASEQRRRIIQTIIVDTRFAYWKAVGAELLLPQIDTLLTEAEDALARSAEVGATELSGPAEFEYAQDLLETIVQLQDLRRELTLAKLELGALMNMEPQEIARLRLADAEQIRNADGRMQNRRLDAEIDAAFSYELEQLTRGALSNRPEIREEIYNGRIAEDDIHQAQLKMLPGMDLSLGASFDSNSFLTNQSWLTGGIALSWNVLKLFTTPAEVRWGEAKKDLAQARRLAVGAAIVTQAHAAMLGLKLARDDFHRFQTLDNVSARLLDLAEARFDAGASSDLALTHARIRSLFARMRVFRARAQLDSSVARVWSSLGCDYVPAGSDTESLPRLTEQVQAAMINSPDHLARCVGAAEPA